MNLACEPETIIYKYFDLGLKQVDTARREVEFIATHQVPDGEGQVVLTHGVDLRRYLANPVILLQHDLDKPVGRTVTLVQKELDGFPALIGEAVFPEDDEDAERCYRKIKAGLLGAMSIGFRSLERGPAIMSGQWDITHIRTELVEISVVTIGSCPTCVITGKAARGRSSRDAEVFEVDERMLDAVLTDTVVCALAETTKEAITAAINAQLGRVD